MNYIISQEQLNGLISYLATKPYSEVCQGIDMLKSLKAIQQESEQEKKEVSNK